MQMEFCPRGQNQWTLYGKKHWRQCTEQRPIARDGTFKVNDYNVGRKDREERREGGVLIAA